MENFDLVVATVDSSVGQLRVQAVSQAAGESDPLVVTVAAMERVVFQLTAPAEQAALASAFTAAVLPASLWAAWRATVAQAGDQGVRLRVQCADAFAASLPWELLYDADRAVFLARDSRTPLVRYLPGPIPHEPAVLASTATVLLTGASPQGLAPVDLAGAWAAVTGAVAGSPLRATAGVRLHAQQLAVHMQRQRPSVLHFVGHARWTGLDDEGKLGLEDERSELQLLPAWALAAALVGQGLRLVVLGACESGLSGTRWAGLAQALVQAGVPAVVAMQDQVTEKTLHAFSRVFYTALAGGRPYDVAMNVARQGLVLDTETPGAWLLPALYMRAGDGRLVATPPPPAQRAATEQPRTQINFHGPVQIGAQVTGDLNNSTIDLRGAMIGGQTRQAAALAPAQTEQALAALRQEFLAHLDRREQALVERLVATLDGKLLEQQRALLAALEEGRLNEYDLTMLLGALEETFVEVQRHNSLLLSLAERTDLAQAQQTLTDHSLDVRQRFKVALPLVLWFLSYEAEFEWDGRVDLEAAMQKLRGRGQQG